MIAVIREPEAKAEHRNLSQEVQLGGSLRLWLPDGSGVLEITLDRCDAESVELLLAVAAPLAVRATLVTEQVVGVANSEERVLHQQPPKNQFTPDPRQNRPQTPPQNKSNG